MTENQQKEHKSGTNTGKEIREGVAACVGLLGILAIPVTIGYMAHRYSDHNQELRQEAAMAVAADGFKGASIYDQDGQKNGGPRYADLPIEAGCTLNGVRIHFQEHDGKIDDVTSYTFQAYIGARLVPDSVIGRHDGGQAIAGQEVTFTFHSKDDLEQNVIGGMPCKQLASAVGFQQSLPYAGN